MELAGGANYVEHNKESVARPQSQHLQRTEAVSRKLSRQREVQQNKAIRDQQKLEKLRFLTEKHDLVRSASLLRRIHAHNHEQKLRKQYLWLQILALTQVCNGMITHYRVI